MFNYGTQMGHELEGHVPRSGCYLQEQIASENHSEERGSPQQYLIKLADHLDEGSTDEAD